MSSLEIEALVKRYRGGTEALKGVSLTIQPGVLGLLGPNGAGKSTLMRMVATVLKPTSGTIRYNGTDIVRDPDALRSSLGYLPQDSGAYPNLSAREFLRYVAALKGMNAKAAELQIGGLLEELNLTSAGNRPLGAFSGGMKQRVGIAQALLKDPQVAIVDEPTVGLDPEERSRFRELIAGIAGERIVILSTHIVSDVESIAERVVMIAGGSIVADGAPAALAAQLSGQVWEGVIAAGKLAELRERYAVTSAIRRRDGVLVRLCGERPTNEFSNAVPTLEEAYLVTVRASRAA
ncbi:MAG TPA: ABC transporter ATP-binding protein [Candidatus Tumulicola sp.]|jgi:ABC-type multidrug transport system ATPase subunit